MPEEKYHIKEVHYRDLYGNLIWKDNIVFRHLWGVGNELIHDFKKYIVRRVAVADDVQHVNIEAVEHSVQRTGLETCDLYGCSEPAVVRLCASHYKPAKKRCSICGQSDHVSSDCGLVLPNPPRR